jgi:peptidoglycan/LPS O-acetylase OafA/YrhL
MTPHAVDPVAAPSGISGSLSTLSVGSDLRVVEQPSARLTYRPELDGLRAIAVLAVMAFHFGLPFAPQGFLGVDIFFVLSGFLISSIIASEVQSSGAMNWRRFYRRRAFRLLPAFWVMLIIVAALVPPAATLSSFGYVINWTTALGLVPINEALGHTWSLAVEWQFYLVWPVILVLALRRLSPRSVVLLALTLGIASAVWRAGLWTIGPDWTRVWHATDTHADGLLLGSALGVVAAFGLVPLTTRLDRGLWGATAIALAVIASLVVILPPSLGFLATLGGPLVAVAIAVVVARVAVFPSGRLGGILSFGPLVRVGVISYGLYLWHVPIRVLMDQNGPVEAAVATALTFAAALLSYRFIETPFLRAKARQPGVVVEPVTA